MKIDLAFLRLIRLNFLALAGFAWFTYVFWKINIWTWQGIFMDGWWNMNFIFVFFSGILFVSGMDGNISNKIGLRYINSRAVARPSPLAFYMVLSAVFGSIFFLVAVPTRNHLLWLEETKRLEANDWYTSDMRPSRNLVSINGHMARKLWESGHEVKNFLYEDWLQKPERMLKTKKLLAAELKIEENLAHLDPIPARTSLLYKKWLKEFKEYKEWKIHNGPFPYEAFDSGWGASAMLRFPSIWVICISAFLLFVSGALLRLSWTYGAPGRVGGILRFILKPRNAVPVGFLSLILLTSSESMGLFGNSSHPYPHSLDVATLYINFHWIVPVFAAVLAFISWALVRQWNLADITDEAV